MFFKLTINYIISASHYTLYSFIALVCMLKVNCVEAEIFRSYQINNSVDHPVALWQHMPFL